MNKVKVLHINTFDKGGGAANLALEYLNRFPETHRLLVYRKFTEHENVQKIGKKAFTGLFKFLGKVIWKLGLKREIREAFSVGESFNNTYNNLVNHEWYQEADIIHVHNLHGGYFDLKALTKITKQKKLVISMHDMWLLTGGETFTLENENYKSGKGETPYNQYYPLYSPIIDRREKMIRLKKKVLKNIAKNTVIVPGSLWLESCVKSSYVYNDQLKVQLIREGANPELFISKKERNWTKPRILIINTGIYYKGTEIYNEVLSNLPKEMELSVLGKDTVLRHGDYEYKQLEFVKGLDNFSALLAEHDILIFPSLQDNSPLVITYALFSGMCVIGADRCGISDQLAEGGGILFDRDNPQDLIDKWTYYVEHLEEARVIGLEGRKRASKLYNSETMFQAYSELYETLKG